MFSGEREQFLRVFFGDRRCELAGVNELELCRLLGHRGGNLRDAVSDEVDGGGSRKIEILVSVGIPHINAFAAHGSGKFFAKRAAKNGRTSPDRGVSHG